MAVPAFARRQPPQLPPRGPALPDAWLLIRSGVVLGPETPLDPADLCLRLEQVKLDEALRKAFGPRSASSSLRSVSAPSTPPAAPRDSLTAGLRFHRIWDAEHQRRHSQEHSVNDSTTGQPPPTPLAVASCEKHELPATGRKDSRTDASTTSSARLPPGVVDRNRASPTINTHHPAPLGLSSAVIFSSIAPVPANSSRPYASRIRRASSAASSGSSSLHQVAVFNSMASKPALPPMAPDHSAGSHSHEPSQLQQGSLNGANHLSSRSSMKYSPTSPPPVHHGYAEGSAILPEPPSLPSAKKSPRPASTSFEDFARPAIVVTPDDAPPLPRSNRFPTKVNFDFGPEGEKTSPPRKIDNSKFAKGSKNYEDRLAVDLPLQRNGMRALSSNRSSLGGQPPPRIVSGDFTLPGPPFATPTSPRFPISAVSRPNSSNRNSATSTLGDLPSTSSRSSARYSQGSLPHHPRLVKKDSLESHRWREKTARERAVMEARARREKEKEGGIGMGSSPVLPSLSPFPPLSLSATPGVTSSPLNNVGKGRRGSEGVVGKRKMSAGSSHTASSLDRRTGNGILKVDANTYKVQLEKKGMSNEIALAALERRMSGSTIKGTVYSTDYPMELPPPSMSDNLRMSNSHRMSGIKPTPILKRASTTNLDRRSLTTQTANTSLSQVSSRAEKRSSKIGSQHAPLPLLLSSPTGTTTNAPPRSHRQSLGGRDQISSSPFPKTPAEPNDSSSSPQETHSRGRRRSTVKDDTKTDLNAVERKRSKSRTSIHSTKSTKSEKSVKSTKSTHSMRSLFSTTSNGNKLQKRNSRSLSRGSRHGGGADVSKEHLAALAALTGPTPAPDEKMTPQSVALLEAQKRQLEERTRRESVAREREERVDALRRGREMEKVLSGDIIAGALGGYREDSDSNPNTAKGSPTEEYVSGRRSKPSSMYGKRRYTMDDAGGDLDTSTEGLTPESIRLLREREKLVRWRAEREKQLFEMKEREREEKVRAANEKEALRMAGLEKGGKKKGKGETRGCLGKLLYAFHPSKG